MKHKEYSKNLGAFINLISKCRQYWGHCNRFSENFEKVIFKNIMVEIEEK